jgi:hypothetical protein
MKKTFLLVFISVGFALLVCEVIVGYFRFQGLTGSYTAIGEVIEIASKKMGHMSRKNVGIQSIEKTRKISLSVSPNPFTSYPSSVGSYRYHPFFDYSNVHVQVGREIKLDYFGFRNNTSKAYFEKDSDFLIILTGGSEAAGFSHDKTISEILEKSLMQSAVFTGKRVKVMNLSMNSYVLGNEINAFVHLAYNMRPNVVITHSGWNDMIYGAMAPAPFQVKGLNYFAPMIDWLPRLYDLRVGNSLKWGRVITGGISHVTDAYMDNLEKYRNIARSGGAYFLAGIQGYNRAPPADNLHEVTHGLMNELESKLPKKPWIINFSQRHDIKFADTVHSVSSAARRIAAVYHAKIIKGIEEGNIRLPRLPEGIILKAGILDALRTTVSKGIKRPLSWTREGGMALVGAK